MVDVSGKPVSDRRAVARGVVRMSPETAALVEAGDAPAVEIAIAIGPVRTIAGRMKLHSGGTSTTLQSVARASASSKSAMLTLVSFVEAITR